MRSSSVSSTRSRAKPGVTNFQALDRPRFYIPFPDCEADEPLEPHEGFYAGGWRLDRIKYALYLGRIKVCNALAVEAREGFEVEGVFAEGAVAKRLIADAPMFLLHVLEEGAESFIESKLT
jgi:hypothetical protein